MHTALDILKLNAATDGTTLIEANKNVAPELAVMPGFSIAGLSYTTLRRISVPEGGFTVIGAGQTPGKSQFENAQFNCYQYKNPIEETNDRARAYRRGVAAFLALTMSGAYQGALRLIGRSFYYGARSYGGNTNAFPGLIDLYGAATKTVDAGGTTDNTASSVWFIKTGSLQDGCVSFVFGNNAGLVPLADWISAMIVPDPTGAPTKKTMGWQNELNAAIGVQLAEPDAVVRIKKLTEDSGKGMTDAQGRAALEKFPVGVIPDYCIMNRRSRRQLQDSRITPENKRPAVPTDVEGIPILITDSLLNTETLAL